MTPAKIIWILLVIGLAKLIMMFTKAFTTKTLKKYSWYDSEKGLQLLRILRYGVIVLSIISIIAVLDLHSSWSDVLNEKIIETGKKKAVDSVGGVTVTIGGLLIFLLVILFARLFVKLLSSTLTNQLERNKSLDDGQRFTIVKLVRYALYVFAFLFAADSAGVNLNTLLVGSAALLVGLGLALQHIFDDIISGFIILFEGTFQVGDVIESDGLVARVLHIDIRTSKVETRDGNIIVVPNRMLTSDKLNNWSHGNDVSRFHVTVGVAYASDVIKVKKIMYQVALAHADVSKNRPIVIRFEDFGDSALMFSVYFWAYRSWDIEVLQSDIRFGIFQAFREQGVEIPFPQRDLHIKTTPGVNLDSSTLVSKD